MMHRIKWIEDNYGISRKAIRNYEEKGLLDKTKNRNPDNNYREYDDEDIDTIRFIKILNGIGYSLDDIKRLSESGAYGFSSLGEKIEKMEKEKDDLEQKINYAKTVKYTGRFLAPSELNTMKADEYQKKVEEKWNLSNIPCGELAIKLNDAIINGSVESNNIELLMDMVSSLNEKGITWDNFSSLLIMTAIPIMLAKWVDEDYKSQLAQGLVSILYRVGCAFENTDMPSQKFAEYMAPSFIEGDMGKGYEKELGKERSEFIANAIAFFGGFQSYRDIVNL